MFLYLKKEKHVAFYLYDLLSKEEIFAKINTHKGGAL